MIYLDNASATKPLKEVMDAMTPYFEEHYGNPLSIHDCGEEPRNAIENAREKLAGLINAKPEEIIFTSCGSESNNLALKGVALANQKKGKHIIISAIEHFSVLHSARALAKMGFEVTEIPADAMGVVDIDCLKKAIRPDTILISVMHANNEIGTIEDIKEIGKIAKENNVLFHSDGVQTIGVMPVDVRELNVDLMSFAGQSFYGPKGSAGLFIKKGMRIFSLIDGGIQENGKRAGTENVPAIAGIGKAAEIAKEQMDKRIEKIVPMRNKLMKELPNRIPEIKLNGHPENRLPGNVNFGIYYIEGEAMLLHLGFDGIYASSGSACTSKALKASHVLTCIGLDHALANGTILFTIGVYNQESDVDMVLEKLPPIVEKLRAMSPLYKKKS